MTRPPSLYPPAVARRLAEALREKAADPRAPEEFRSRWLASAERLIEQSREAAGRSSNGGSSC